MIWQATFGACASPQSVLPPRQMERATTGRRTAKGIDLEVSRDTRNGLERVTLSLGTEAATLSPEEVDWLVGALRGRDWLRALNSLEHAALSGNVWDVLRVVARIRSMRR